LVVQSGQHPTLRQYVSQPGTSTSEIDPQFSLFPTQCDRVEVIDEIQIKKQSMAQDIKSNGLKPISENYTISKQKTKGGCFINSLDIPTSLIPGNFGCRVVDNMMPSDLSVVHKDRRSTLL
jgi:hypothetical protein